jgi:hypothetical protein
MVQRIPSHVCYRAGQLASLDVVGSNIPITALGVTGPRTWDATGWVFDIVPHLAYGAVTAAGRPRCLERRRT